MSKEFSVCLVPLVEVMISIQPLKVRGVILCSMHKIFPMLLPLNLFTLLTTKELLADYFNHR